MKPLSDEPKLSKIIMTNLLNENSMFFPSVKYTLISHYVKYSEYGFSLTRIFPYMNKIVDSVLIRVYTCQRKPLFLYVLRSAICRKQISNILKTNFFLSSALNNYSNYSEKKYIKLFENFGNSLLI